MSNHLLELQQVYLVGIKGVAMCSLAACLIDAGIKVVGCDIAEDFVTAGQLTSLGIHIEIGFEKDNFNGIDAVIFTAAHNGPDNPVVLAAKKQGLTCLTHAEALAQLFNTKRGLAVCGVGGKSTTSAMVAFICQQTTPQSFTVGVGEIMDIPNTGRWLEKSEFFIAEADEYVTDPNAASKGAEITPRFSFLEPEITICTNLKFDHPDVYRDFEHTKSIFEKFFKNNTKSNGSLIVSSDSKELVDLGKKVSIARPDIEVITVGHNNADWLLSTNKQDQIILTHTISNYSCELHLQIPGIYNYHNAAFAIAASYKMGIPINKSVEALSKFRSTKRRAELVRMKHDITYYDDYAHHPDELSAVIMAYSKWKPNQRILFAFQPHTFSRTKKLFSEFSNALNNATELVIIDIFPSAREAFDATISSLDLVNAINKMRPPELPMVKYLPTISDLATYCHQTLLPGDICITLGAGDIYQVHELL